MPLQIIQGDITKLSCDAIVNAANETLLGGGGVDGAIHRAAGPELLEACRPLGGCRPGEAKLTPGFRLPCKYVIHTVGPIWHGGGYGERALLESCYRNSLALAAEHCCESVAFPLISAGAYGYPKADALRVALDVIADFLLTHDMTVTLVIFSKSDYRIDDKLLANVSDFLDANSEPVSLEECSMLHTEADACPAPERRSAPCASRSSLLRPLAAAGSTDPDLQQYVRQLDESFTQMLLRKIDEKGMTDVECYKKANVDRKLFSKIRSDLHYRPGKPTAIAFAIALELPLEETRDLLMKAGFALSHSNTFDLIVEYFIRARNYKIHDINEALFAFDQPLLG